MRAIVSRALAGLALLLLAAHFYRAGLMPLTVLCAMLVGLLFVRATWGQRVLQAVLALGTLEWLRTAWVFAAARAAQGQPYGRLLAILGAVAAVTALAALLLPRSTLRNPREFR
jgi:lysylphosphatidylglycerol synthetase-like protein (DUF2156 family)